MDGKGWWREKVEHISPFVNSGCTLAGNFQQLRKSIRILETTDGL
jgi:hypothetical protein